jgi:2-hydroxychromene-2-carboxylate isomerase
MQFVVVPVHYDFASTICYVAHCVMQRVDLAEIGVELVWEPLDLGFMMGWKAGSPVEGPRRANALRVARELDVELHMPGAWLDSKPALAVALALQGTPQEAAWRERVWSSAYQEMRDPGDPDELERLCCDLGVEASPARDEAVLDRLARRTRAAAEDAVTGLPAFMLAGLPIGGIQEPGTMQRMLGRYAERQRAG